MFCKPSKNLHFSSENYVVLHVADPMIFLLDVTTCLGPRLKVLDYMDVKLLVAGEKILNFNSCKIPLH